MFVLNPVYGCPVNVNQIQQKSCLNIRVLINFYWTIIPELIGDRNNWLDTVLLGYQGLCGCILYYKLTPYHDIIRIELFWQYLDAMLLSWYIYIIVCIHGTILNSILTQIKANKEISPSLIFDSAKFLVKIQYRTKIITLTSFWWNVHNFLSLASM